MIAVSLDQNFLSEFAKGTLGEAARLRTLLQRGVATGKIVCPIHGGETVFESVLTPRTLRKAIFDVASDLSGGVGFQNIAICAGIEMLQLVRPDLHVPFIVPDDLRNWINGDLNQLGAQHRGEKANYRRRMDALKYPPSQYTRGMKRDEVWRSIANDRACHMWRLVEAIKTKGNLETGQPEWEVTEEIARFLLQFQVTTRECDQLIEHIRYHRWDGIPTMFVHTRLCAELEWDCLTSNRQTKSNDIFDLWRLGVALNYADVVLCDLAMQQIILRTKMFESNKGPLLYAPKQLSAAIKYFESLCGY